MNLGRYALYGRYGDLSCSLLIESSININELIIDLPNLTSITSYGWDNFYYTRSVTLSSLILNDWMMNRYSESSNS